MKYLASLSINGFPIIYSPGFAIAEGERIIIEARSADGSRKTLVDITEKLLPEPEQMI